MISRALKRAARIVQPSASGLVILIYHRVGAGTPSAVDLPLDVFRRQLAWLAEHRTVVSLDAAIGALADGVNVDDWTVLTFDDGTVDFTEHALPALSDVGLPATLYLSTSLVDEQRPFPWGAPPVSWAALRDASTSRLITVGSHTHTHKLLDRCDEATIVDELDRSIDRIGTELGQAPMHGGSRRHAGELVLCGTLVGAAAAMGARGDAARVWYPLLALLATALAAQAWRSRH